MKASKSTAGVQFLDPVISMGDLERQNRQVRSLTMRRVRQNHWWKSRTKKPKNSTKPLEDEAGVKSRIPVKFIFIPSDFEDNLRPQMAMDRIDPFHTLPLENGQRSSVLLNHYLTVMSPPSRKHGAMRASWFQFAHNHPAFLNALLCTSAMHRYAMKTGSYIDVVEQTNLVVHDININLGNPAVATSLENLAAVAWLYFITISPLQPPMGSKFEPWDVEQQPLVHLSGLQRMLALIGGLQAISGHPLLYTCLLWFQTQQATRQRFVPGCIADGRYAELAFHEATDYVMLGSRNGQELSSIMELIQRLSTDFDAWENELEVSADGIYLLQRCCFIVLALLQMYSGMTDGLRSLSTHDEVRVLGCLIFTNFLTDCLNFNGQIIQVTGKYPPGTYRSEPLYEMAKLLRKAMDRAEMHEPLPYKTQLWAAVLGAIVSWGTAHRLWFESQLIKLSIEGNLNNADDMIAVLLETVWLASDFSWHASELWYSVMGS